MSGRTTTLLHRSRDSKRAAVARNARSAVVKRGRVPPDRGSSAGGGARPSRDPAHRRRTGRADGAGRKGAGTAQTRAPRQSELSRSTCPPTARSEPRSSFFTPRALGPPTAHGRLGADERHNQPAGGRSGQPTELLDGVSGAVRFSRTVASSPSIQRTSATGKAGIRGWLMGPRDESVKSARPRLAPLAPQAGHARGRDRSPLPADRVGGDLT